MAMGEERNWLRLMPRGRRKLFTLARASRLVSSLGVIELILDIINIILIIISFHTSTPCNSQTRRSTDEQRRLNRRSCTKKKKETRQLTPVSSVSSLALWAALSSIFPLVLIARTTHREGTFIASHKDIVSLSEPNIVTTDLTYMPIHVLGRFGLQFYQRCTIVSHRVLETRSVWIQIITINKKHLRINADLKSRRVTVMEQ